MSKEAHIPLSLWVCAAMLAHLAGGRGAGEVAQVVEDKAQLRHLIVDIRELLRPNETTFEILTDAEPTPSASSPTLSHEASEATPSDAESSAKDRTRKAVPTEPKHPEVVPREVPPETPKHVELRPPASLPLPASIMPKELAQEAVKPAPPSPPVPKGKIAVRQHVEKDQEDNPSASRIADDANLVKEETVARIRSYDQDNPDPSAGNQSGPRGEEGDANENKAGQSEDRDGDPFRAPGEAKEASTSSEHHNPAPPAAKDTKDGGAPKKGGEGRTASVPSAPAPNAGGAGPASPEAHASERGSFSLDPANPGGDGRSKVAGNKVPQNPYKRPVRTFGLGESGEPGSTNINLSVAGVAQAVGYEKLKQERAAEGASRRSAHRGVSHSNDFQKWRAAIENYEPSVKLGNTTALNAARVPFAGYLNLIHNRLHPIFAEEFLGSLDSLPQKHALNQDLVTHLEIVLSKDQGRIVRMGVTRPSGSTAFDIVALNSVERASPFGKAPSEIVSPDGNVYLHWEFHRDPFDACSTKNASPKLLKGPPAEAPENRPLRRPSRPVPADEREGRPILPVN